MFVRNRMTKETTCVDPRDSLAKVYATIKEKGFEGLPVTRNGKVVGVIALWDIVTRLAETDDSETYLQQTMVESVMTTQPITIHEDAIIEEAALIMHREDVSLLPVVDDSETVVGVITQSDFFKIFVEILGLERPGTRIALTVGDKVGELARLTDVIRRHGASIISLVTFEPDRPFGDVVLRIGGGDSKEIVDALVEAGFKVAHVSQVWA